VGALEREILVSLLRLTQDRAISRELLIKQTRVSRESVDHTLQRISQDGLVTLNGDLIEATPRQRLQIAIQVLKLGADLQHVCELLSWAELENITAEAFEANGYRVLKNFRFKQNQRRWEVDVMGIKEPFIICVDCKHWKHGWRKAAATKAAESQTQRTKALADALPAYASRMKINPWHATTLIPVVVSLTSTTEKFSSQVPVVPIVQLRDFIYELPCQAHLLTAFNQKRGNLTSSLIDFCQ
jgi:Holliday junction resolvase-like predicted endonuclease